MSKINLSIFKALQVDRKENAKVLQKPALRGVWAGIIDKYPESAHFVYELLQNADDAKATTAQIYLGKGGLLFMHNGTEHFTISDPATEEVDREAGRLGHLNSITSVGASTKLTADNKIGKFGVGFKAVFQYTQTPEIYDENVNFRLEQNIVPILIEKDHPLRKKGETLFNIPFNKEGVVASKSYSAIFRKLQELNEPLLFMNNLEEIVWTRDGDSSKYRYTKKRLKRLSFDDISGELYELHNAAGRKSTIWLFTKKITIAEVGTYPISVGYYLDNKGRINTSVRPYVFCFFPTKESMDLCCIMHAPFALVDSRQNIKHENDINDELFRGLSDLAARALTCLRKIGMSDESYLIDDNIFDIVPLKSSKPYYNWYVEDEDNTERNWKELFYDAYRKVLQQDEIFLTNEKKYVAASSGRWVVRPIRELLTRMQLNQLIAKYKDPNITQIPLKYNYVACSVPQNEQEKLNYLESLGIERLSLEGFGQMLTRQFMEKQKDEWLTKFYDFLCRDDAHRLIDVYNANGSVVYGILRTKEIIRTSTGQFVPAYIGKTLNVFRSDGNEIPNMHYVDRVLFSTDNGRKLLDKLGVKEPDKSNYIISVLMPKYKNSNGKDIKMAEVKTDFKEIFKAYQSCANSEVDKFITMLKENYKLKVEHSTDLVVIENGIIYQPLPELRTYFSKSVYSGIVDLPFYASCVGEANTNALLELFRRLELSDHVLILRRTLNAMDCHDKYYQQIYSSSPYYNITISGGTDFVLHDLDKWSGTPFPREVTLCIWNALLAYMEVLSDYMAVEVYYSTRRKNIITRLDKSTLAKILLNKKWLYNLEGKPKVSSAVYREDLDPMYTPNETIFRLLNINPSPRVKDMNIIKEQCSAESQRDFALGMAASAMGFSSVEEMREARRLLEAKKQKEREDELARKEALKRKEEENKNAPGPLMHHNQEKHTAEEMFSNVKDLKKTTQPSDKAPDPEKEQQRRAEILTAEQHQADLEQLASDESTKYTYKWFQTLLELEFLKSGEKETSEKGISLYFNKVTSDPHSPRCLLLRNPSREIPRAIEEMGSVDVTFYVDGIKDCAISFEAASVIDYTLRLKCKNEDIKKIEQLKSIQSHISRAELKTNSPIKLISSLRSCFDCLNFDPDYSLKENIDPRIKFIFGPPGTGKTTYLVNTWIRKVAESVGAARMLILCPTNKAADVIASRAIEVLSPEHPDLQSWMGRFVATADENLSDYVCSRDTDFYMQEKCCVISTIARFSFDQFHSDYIRDIDWDYIVIDEASMIPLAEIIYPIYRCPNAQIVVAGDPLQIDPIVNERLWESENIYTMVNLKDFVNPQTEPCQFDIHNLSTQYRSVPAIGRLFSEYAYQGEVQSYRKQASQRPLNIDRYNVKSVNFIHFPVEKYQSIYSAQKVSNSSVHVYSILFAKELVNYLAAQIEKNHPDEIWRIGIICPYRAQAELINKLWEQRTELYPNVEVQVGTVHGFQGDECDIILAVYNPPASGMKRAADRTFVNRKNILNVAISRAKDYLFILMPDKKYENFDNLVEARRVGHYALEQRDSMSFYHSQEIEKIIFGDDNYLFNNSFVTNHQLGNVYTKPISQYEIRLDDSSMDIQVKE